MLEQENTIFQVPATITKVSSMSNRAIRLQVDTQEQLTDEQMAKLMKHLDKYGHFTHLIDREIDTTDLIATPKLRPKEEGRKSQATRLRNSLYILWKQNGEKGDSEMYYHTQMEKFIDAVKEKLN